MIKFYGWGFLLTAIMFGPIGTEIPGANFVLSILLGGYAIAAIISKD